MELVLTILLQYIREMPEDDTGVQIAKILMMHLKDVRHMSLESVASLCTCSASTFTRFLKNLGISNFRELRRMVSAPKTTYNTIGFSQADYTSHILENIRMVSQSATPNLIRKISLMIRDAGCICFVAFPTNYFPIYDFQCKMMMEGKYIEYISHNEQVKRLRELTRDDLVIFVSFQGNLFSKTSHYENPLADLSWIKADKILITQMKDVDQTSVNTIIHCGRYSFYGEGIYALMYVLNLLYVDYRNLMNLS
jgi:DNA-binding MurR/RpiR family transcriptional regulator